MLNYLEEIAKSISKNNKLCSKLDFFNLFEKSVLEKDGLTIYYGLSLTFKVHTGLFERSELITIYCLNEFNICMINDITENEYLNGNCNKDTIINTLEQIFNLNENKKIA